MQIANEEIKSILEEMQNSKLREDLKLLSALPKRMELLEHLNFLTAISNMPNQRLASRRFVEYKKVIF